MAKAQDVIANIAYILTLGATPATAAVSIGLKESEVEKIVKDSKIKDSSVRKKVVDDAVNRGWKATKSLQNGTPVARRTNKPSAKPKPTVAPKPTAKPKPTTKQKPNKPDSEARRKAATDRLNKIGIKLPEYKPGEDMKGFQKRVDGVIKEAARREKSAAPKPRASAKPSVAAPKPTAAPSKEHIANVNLAKKIIESHIKGAPITDEQRAHIVRHLGNTPDYQRIRDYERKYSEAASKAKKEKEAQRRVNAEIERKKAAGAIRSGRGTYNQTPSPRIKPSVLSDAERAALVGKINAERAAARALPTPPVATGPKGRQAVAYREPSEEHIQRGVNHVLNLAEALHGPAGRKAVEGDEGAMLGIRASVSEALRTPVSSPKLKSDQVDKIIKSGGVATGIIRSSPTFFKDSKSPFIDRSAKSIVRTTDPATGKSSPQKYDAGDKRYLPVPAGAVDPSIRGYAATDIVGKINEIASRDPELARKIAETYGIKDYDAAGGAKVHETKMAEAEKTIERVKQQKTAQKESFEKKIKDPKTKEHAQNRIISNQRKIEGVPKIAGTANSMAQAIGMRRPDAKGGTSANELQMGGRIKPEEIVDQAKKIGESGATDQQKADLIKSIQSEADTKLGAKGMGPAQAAIAREITSNPEIASKILPAGSEGTIAKISEKLAAHDVKMAKKSGKTPSEPAKKGWTTGKKPSEPPVKKTTKRGDSVPRQGKTTVPPDLAPGAPPIRPPVAPPPVGGGSESDQIKAMRIRFEKNGGGAGVIEKVKEATKAAGITGKQTSDLVSKIKGHTSAIQEKGVSEFNAYKSIYLAAGPGKLVGKDGKPTNRTDNFSRIADMAKEGTLDTPGAQALLDNAARVALEEHGQKQSGSRGDTAPKVPVEPEPKPKPPVKPEPPVVPKPPVKPEPQPKPPVKPEPQPKPPVKPKPEPKPKPKPKPRVKATPEPKPKTAPARKPSGSTEKSSAPAANTRLGQLYQGYLDAGFGKREAMSLAKIQEGMTPAEERKATKIVDSGMDPKAAIKQVVAEGKKNKPTENQKPTTKPKPPVKPREDVGRVPKPRNEPKPRTTAAEPPRRKPIGGKVSPAEKATPRLRLSAKAYADIGIHSKQAQKVYREAVQTGSHSGAIKLARDVQGAINSGMPKSKVASYLETRRAGLSHADAVRSLTQPVKPVKISTPPPPATPSAARQAPRAPGGFGGGGRGGPRTTSGYSGRSFGGRPAASGPLVGESAGGFGYPGANTGIIGSAQNAIGQITKSVVTAQIIGKFGQIFSQITGGLIGFNMKLEESNIAFKTLFINEQRAMGTFTGDTAVAAQQAEILTKQIQNFANVTPFRFPELVTAAERMKAFGFSTQEIMPSLKGIGDAVAALGGEDDKLRRITYALGQMKQAGRVYQNDMMQISNAGIAGYEILAKGLIKEFISTGQVVLKTGKDMYEYDQNNVDIVVQDIIKNGEKSSYKIASAANSQIFTAYKALSIDPVEAIRRYTKRGTIDGKAAARVIIQGLETTYRGGMDQLSRSMQGAISTVQDTSQYIIATAFKPMYDQIKEFFYGLGQFMMGAGGKRVADGLAATIGKFGEAAGTILPKIGSQIKKFIGAFTGAGSSVGATLSDVKVGGESLIKFLTGTFGTGIKYVIDIINTKFGQAAISAIAAMKIIGTAIAANPIVLAFGAVITAIGMMVRGIQEVNAMGGMTAENFSTITEEQKNTALAARQIQQAFTDMGNTFTRLKASVGPGLSRAFTAIAKAISSIGSKTLVSFVGVLEKFLTVISKVIESIAPYAGELAQVGLAFMTMKVASAGINTITTTISAFAAALTTVAGAAVLIRSGGIKKIIGGILGGGIFKTGAQITDKAGGITPLGSAVKISQETGAPMRQITRGESFETIKEIVRTIFKGPRAVSGPILGPSNAELMTSKPMLGPSKAELTAPRNAKLIAPGPTLGPSDAELAASKQAKSSIIADIKQFLIEIKYAINDIRHNYKDIIRAFASDIKAGLMRPINGLKNIISTIKYAINDIRQNYKDIIRAFASDMKAGLMRGINGFKAILSDIGGALKIFARGIAAGFKDGMSVMKASFVADISKMAGMAKFAARASVDFIGWGIVIEVVIRNIGKIIAVIGDFIGAIIRIVGAIPEIISSLGSLGDVFGWLSSTIQSFTDFISVGLGKALDVISAEINQIVPEDKTVKIMQEYADQVERIISIGYEASTAEKISAAIRDMKIAAAEAEKQLNSVNTAANAFMIFGGDSFSGIRAFLSDLAAGIFGTDNAFSKMYANIDEYYRKIKETASLRANGAFMAFYKGSGENEQAAIDAIAQVITQTDIYKQSLIDAGLSQSEATRISKEFYDSMINLITASLSAEDPIAALMNLTPILVVGFGRIANAADVLGLSMNNLADASTEVTITDVNGIQQKITIYGKMAQDARDAQTAIDSIVSAYANGLSSTGAMTSVEVEEARRARSIELQKKLAQAVLGLFNGNQVGPAQAIANVMAEFNAMAGSVDTGALWQAEEAITAAQEAADKLKKSIDPLVDQIIKRIQGAAEKQFAERIQIITKILDEQKQAEIDAIQVRENGIETTYGILQKEIAAQEKKNRVLQIEQGLLDAKKNVANAALASFGENVDPLAAAIARRDAEEAMTKAIQDAELERKKLALDEQKDTIKSVEDQYNLRLEIITRALDEEKNAFQEAMDKIVEKIKDGSLSGQKAVRSLRDAFTNFGITLPSIVQKIGASGTEPIGRMFDILINKSNAYASKINEIAVLEGRVAGIDAGGGKPRTPKQQTADQIAAQANIDFNNQSYVQAIRAQILEDLQIATDIRNAELAVAPKNVAEGRSHLAEEYDKINKSIPKGKASQADMEKIQTAFNVWRMYLAGESVKLDGTPTGFIHRPFPKRASGGPVSARTSYLVGEKGPEILTMGTGIGQIISNAHVGRLTDMFKSINVRSPNMATNMGYNSGGKYEMSVVINNPQVRSSSDIDAIVDAVNKSQMRMARKLGYR